MVLKLPKVPKLKMSKMPKVSKALSKIKAPKLPKLKTPKLPTTKSALALSLASIKPSSIIATLFIVPIVVAFFIIGKVGITGVSAVYSIANASAIILSFIGIYINVLGSPELMMNMILGLFVIISLTIALYGMSAGKKEKEA